MALSRTGMTTVTSRCDGPLAGRGAPRSHRAASGPTARSRVVHLQPTTAEHRLRGGREPQQPRGRPAEERRPLPEHPDPSVHLHGEPIGQRGPVTADNPPAPGVPRRDRRAQSRPFQQRYATRRRPVAVVGLPSTPTGLTAATPPRASGASGPTAAPRCPSPSPRCAPPRAKYVAIQTFRCGRRARRRRPRCRRTTRRHDPHRRSSPTAAATAATLPPWPLTNTSRGPSHSPTCRTRPAGAAAQPCRWTPCRGIPGALRWPRTQSPARAATSRASRSAIPLATADAILVSVSTGRCGPCCSVEPSGMINAGDRSRSCLAVEFPSSLGKTTRRS